MKVVTKIEVIDVEEDELIRHAYTNRNQGMPVYPYSSDGEEVQPMLATHETIKGRKFCNYRPINSIPDYDLKNFTTEKVLRFEGGREKYYAKDCITIGWSKGIEDMLNLPLSYFEDIETDKSILKVEYFKKGYEDGKNAGWDFLKWNGPDTDYWWLPIFIFIGIAILLM